MPGYLTLAFPSQPTPAQFRPQPQPRGPRHSCLATRRAVDPNLAASCSTVPSQCLPTSQARQSERAHLPTMAMGWVQRSQVVEWETRSRLVMEEDKLATTM